MSTTKTDTLTSATSNTDLTIIADGTGDVIIDGLTQPTADGSADQYVKTDGAGNLGFATPSSGGFTLMTPVATTSGTSHTFGSIPSGVTMIIMSWNGVQMANSPTGGTLDITIGDSGGIETSGYVSIRGEIDTTPNMQIVTNSFSMKQVGANNYTFSGHMVLCLESAAAFTWTANGFAAIGSVETLSGTAGVKSLSAELTQIKMGNSGGQAFSAGEVSVQYI